MYPSNVSKGKYAEDLAIEYLLARNLQFISRNFYTSLGEIDVTMYDPVCDQLVFVEVKSRFDELDPIVNVTNRKVQRIFHSINTFFQHQPQLARKDYRLDFVGVNSERIYWIPNLELGVI